MPNIVWYRPLDGCGETRLDLDACVRRYVFNDDDDERPRSSRWDRVTFAFYQAPDGTWVEHFWQPDPFEVIPRFDPGECAFHAVPAYYVEEKLGWPPNPIEASQSDPGESASNPSPPSRERCAGGRQAARKTQGTRPGC